MATINYLFRSIKPSGKLTLRLSYSLNGKGIHLENPTKIIVTKDYWDKNHFAKKNSDILINNLKNEISSKTNQLTNYILTEFEKSSIDEINKLWLSEKVNQYYNPKTYEAIPLDLVSFFDYYLKYRKNELKAPSVMKLTTIQTKLKEFQDYRKKIILITDVNEIFMNEFIDYYKLNNYAHNTTQREFSFVKTVCKKAKFIGMEVSHQLEGLNIKPKKVDSIYLTIEELQLIENTIFEDKQLKNAKDWLIISVNCGQRVSDFMRFSTEMIRTEGEDKFIEFTQQKTGKLMTVPLHKKILDILNERNFQFPEKIGHQDYNQLLKKVCEIAGITYETYGGKQIGHRKVYGDYKKSELVSSHIGRRSFATNNYGIIPTSYLKYLAISTAMSLLLFPI